MRLKDETAAAQACPACRSSDVKTYPASWNTGIQLLGCRVCGLRALADKTALTLSADETDAKNAAYDYEAYLGTKRESADGPDRDQILTRLAAMTRDRPERTLFDLGAGDGKFCDQARGYGFGVGGNEVSPEAVELARERHGVELALGTLDQLALEDAHDVVTMWCVLAHVPDADGLLADVHRLLKPGGVLYLQTPRYSVLDRAAMTAMEMSSGRVSKFVDARVVDKHWMLHTVRSITAMLARHGFVDIEAVPRARFSLTSDFYLRAFGMPDRLVGPVSRAADFAIDRGAVPRIVLDVYARKAD